jgi:hypothetical protein
MFAPNIFVLFRRRIELDAVLAVASGRMGAVAV